MDANLIEVEEGPDAEGAGATGGQQVPDAVADDHGVHDIDAQPFRGSREKIGVGFGVEEASPG